MSEEQGAGGAAGEQQAAVRSGGGSGRLLAWLVAPVAAVVPWLVTVLGAGILAHAGLSMQVGFEQSWGLVLGGVLVLVVAALLWAALTAWSSTGALVAGLCTLAVGLFNQTSTGMGLVGRIGHAGPVSFAQAVFVLASSPTLLVVGSLLLAMGLAAAGVRRLGRRRG